MSESVQVTSLDRFARLYDADTIDLTEDIQLYRGFARRTGGPILEVGCGTGRIVVPLAGDGFDVVGLDISPAMLDVARRNVQEAGRGSRVRLVQADARDFSLDARFRLAIIALNTLMHSAADGEPERVLRSVNRHLDPGGLLILDLPNPEVCTLRDSGGQMVHEWTRPGSTPDSLLLKFRAQRVDVARQLVDLLLLFDEVAADGQVRRTALPFTLRYFHPREVELLLDKCGYEVEAVYGSYDLDPLEAESPAMIYVARRV